MKYSIFRLCICGMFVLSFCGCINSQNKKTFKTFPKTEKKIDVRSLVEQMRKDRNPRTRCEDIRTSDFASLKQWVKTFEPLTFVSLFWKKVAVFIFFRGFLMMFLRKSPFGWAENFSLLHKKERTEMFLQSDRKPTMIKLLKLNCGTERSLYQMSLPRPFFLLSLFRSLPTGFFYASILPTESQAFTAISSPRQRTNRER